MALDAGVSSDLGCVFQVVASAAVEALCALPNCVTRHLQCCLHDSDVLLQGRTVGCDRLMMYFSDGTTCCTAPWMLVRDPRQYTK